MIIIISLYTLSQFIRLIATSGGFVGTMYIESFRSEIRFFWLAISITTSEISLAKMEVPFSLTIFLVSDS